MHPLVFTTVFLLTDFVRLCVTFSTSTANYDLNATYYVPTNLSLRETAFDITDYGCGSKGFCNKSLATQSGDNCVSCSECRCDYDCLLYGDCCPDRLFQSEDEATEPLMDLSCLEPHLKWSRYNYPPPIFVYTTCPKVFSDAGLKRKCEQPSYDSIDEITLVSVRNITYRNKYCAMCHTKHPYTAWRRTVRCKSSNLPTSVDQKEVWKFVLDTDDCEIEPIIPVNVQYRPCQTGLVHQCNSTGVWGTPDQKSELLCGLYYHPVLHGSHWYKNIFCAICNGAVLSQASVCKKTEITPSDDGSYPLSVLIDLNPKPRQLSNQPSTNDIPVTRIQCNVSSIYDPFSNTCKQFLCSFGRILSQGNCEAAFQSSSGLGYSGAVSLEYPQTLSVSTWGDILHMYIEKLKEYLEVYKPFILHEVRLVTMYKIEETVIEDRLPLFQVKAIGGRIDFYFISTHSGDQLSLEDTLRNAQEIEIAFYHNNQSHSLTSQPIPCPDQPLYDEKNGENILSQVERTPGFVLCLKNCFLDDVPFTPIVSLMNCSYLEYNLSMVNFTFHYFNSSVEIDNQLFTLESNQFSACGDIIRICKGALLIILETLTENEPNPRDNTTPFNRVSVSSALNVVSIVCMALSLGCIFLTFIVYCLLRSLRTLPGKNTMVLLVYLFFAQLLFQVGNRLNYDPKLCQAMGVLIHFLWVGTFMSMGVCAFHMHSVFTNMSWSTYPENAESTKLAIYLLSINTVSLILVGTCVVYHLGLSHGVEIGYGGEICFIQLPMDIGIFFAAPLGIILIFNTFCFVRVVIAIRNVPDMATTRNTANRNHLNVYFRLSGLLGFCWVFGFIASAIQVEGLWYAFIILNGLQGVFIFVAYCVNKRTLVMVRDACGCKPSDQYQPGDQTISSMPATLRTSN